MVFLNARFQRPLESPRVEPLEAQNPLRCAGWGRAREVVYDEAKLDREGCSDTESEALCHEGLCHEGLYDEGLRNEGL